MATSGVTSLSYSVNDIIEEALDVLGVAADGETLSGDLFARGKRSINMLLRQWQSQGMHQWTMTDGYLFPTKGVESFDLSTARVVNSYTRTTTAAAASSGALTITVSSDDNISNGDVIGVLLSTGVMQWTTVNGAPAADVVTLTAALAADVSSGAAVFNYDSAQTFKPVERVLGIRRTDSTGYDIEMSIYSRIDYQNLPNKSEQSVPVVAHIARQAAAPTIYLWPTVQTENIVIPFTYERTIEAADAAANTFDLPEYWFDALHLNLAVKLSTKLGTNPVRLQEIKEQAAISLNLALSYDNDVADWRFKI